MANAKREWKAFVLMPFEDKFDLIYRYVLVPALESAGFKVHRADSTLDQRNIIKDIIESIDSADLVIAEITTLDPNVMWEVGVAHALLKPTLQLTLAIEDAPFDLKAYRMIPYSTSQEKIEELQNKLREIGTKLKEGNIIFENPVSDFAPSLQEKKKKITPIHELKEEKEIPKEEGEELGILDFLAGSIGATEKIASITNEMTEESRLLSEQVQTRTQQFNKLKEEEASPAQMLREVRGMSTDMINFSNRIEERLPEFRKAWDGYIEYTSQYLAIVKLENEEERESALEARSSTLKFNESISKAIESIQDAKEGISTLREKRISRDLSVGVKRTIQALNGVVEILSIGESYTARVINLFDERLGEQEDIG